MASVQLAEMVEALWGQKNARQRCELWTVDGSLVAPSMASGLLAEMVEALPGIEHSQHLNSTKDSGSLEQRLTFDMLKLKRYGLSHDLAYILVSLAAINRLTFVQPLIARRNPVRAAA